MGPDAPNLGVEARIEIYTVDPMASHARAQDHCLR